MSNDTHAGTLSDRFGSDYRFFGNAKIEPRKKHERRTSRTQKEKTRKLVRTKLVNFRTTPEIHSRLKTLAKDNSMTMTEVLEAGLQLFAETKGHTDA